MSADRELLEMAAKAAGIGLLDVRTMGATLLMREGGTWNPLIDDEDAFRLAVKLGIQSCWFASLGYAIAFLVPPVSAVIEIQEYGTDPYAATRRAIVRAAAAIGKAMP